ncbi:MAG: transcription elongation factor GreB [Colwellia sp.]
MKTAILTREGFNLLKAELDKLWRVDRRETTKQVSWAASLGDRSENADYKENKRKLRQLDSRIRYITKRLEAVRVVDYNPAQDGKVFFGAWVEIENSEGEVKKIRLVGYDEIFGRKDYISIDSPMAKSLLKKEVDDVATVFTPHGEVEWFINAIWYQED